MDGRLILVVDDDTTFATLLGQVLESDGWQVLIANRFEDAVDQISSNPEIVLVICDVELGAGQNGVTLISRLKHLNPNVASVLTTGHREDTVSALLDGLETDVIFKPFRIDELLARVRTLCGEPQ